MTIEALRRRWESATRRTVDAEGITYRFHADEAWAALRQQGPVDVAALLAVAEAGQPLYRRWVSEGRPAIADDSDEEPTVGSFVKAAMAALDALDALP